MSLEPIGVVLDASAVPATPYGAGRYTLELASALLARDDVYLSVVSRRDDSARWRGLVRARRATVVAAAPASRPARLVWGELLLGRRVRGLDTSELTVLHGPHYSLPRASPLPAVVTVHDLTFVEHPEWHQATKVAYFSHAIARAALEAACVICPSTPVAERFSERFRPRGRVVVVPHGVDHDLFRPTSPTGARSDVEVLEATGVHPPYVLHLGTIEPRKDLPRLVAAFDALAGAQRELELVLAGRDGWGTDALEAAITASRHAGRIRRLGYVPETMVPVLLRNASVVAYPSLEEGFGLPALEALACGAPLVTTLGSVMAELAGGAALAVEPGDPGRLGEAIEAMLAGGPDLGARRALGLELASARTWQASAAAHVGTYRLAASR